MTKRIVRIRRTSLENESFVTCLGLVEGVGCGGGSTVALDSLGSKLAEAPHVLPNTAVDRFIGLHPAAIWLYLSFFVFQTAGFSFVSVKKRRALTTAFIGCASAALVVFLLWPTTLDRVPLSAAGTGWALLLVRLVDTAANCLPSLHVALSALSAAAVSFKRVAGETPRLELGARNLLVCHHNASALFYRHSRRLASRMFRCPRSIPPLLR